jgi:hypothetical protein
MFLMVTSGCVTYFGYEGLYEGLVIDKDTRQPIEGAVVHGTWSRSYPGQEGVRGSYYDSKDVLTDKEGKFNIDGVGMLLFSQIEEMEINVLKNGYSQLSNTSWSGLNNYSSPSANAELIGEKAVIKLRRMSLEERKTRRIDLPSSEPDIKQRLLRNEYNKEMIESGRATSSLLANE